MKGMKKLLLPILFYLSLSSCQMLPKLPNIDTNIGNKTTKALSQKNTTAHTINNSSSGCITIFIISGVFFTLWFFVLIISYDFIKYIAKKKN